MPSCSFRKMLADYVLSGHSYLHIPTAEANRFLAELRPTALPVVTVRPHKSPQKRQRRCLRRSTRWGALKHGRNQHRRSTDPIAARISSFVPG